MSNCKRFLILVLLILIAIPLTVAQSEQDTRDVLLYRHHTPDGMSVLIPEFFDVDYTMNEAAPAGDNDARPQIHNLTVVEGDIRIALQAYSAADVMTRDELRQNLIDNLLSNGYEEREIDDGRILAGAMSESRAVSSVRWIYDYDDYDSLLVVSIRYQSVRLDAVTIQTILESVLYDPQSPTLNNEIYMDGGLIATVPSYLSLDHNTRQNLLVVRDLDRTRAELMITRAFAATLPDDIDPDDLMAVADFDRSNTVFNEVFYNLQIGDVTVMHVSPSDNQIKNTGSLDTLTHGYVRRLNDAVFISAGLEYLNRNSDGTADLLDDSGAILASIRSTKPDEVDCRMQFADNLTVHADSTPSSDVLETVPAETDIQITSIQLAREGNFDPFPPRGFERAREQFYLIWQTDTGWIFPREPWITEDGFCYRVPIGSLAE